MLVTTILYDLGGTLIGFDSERTYTALAGRSGRPVDDVRRIVDARYDEFCRGRITAAAWRSYLAEALGTDLPEEGFRALWADIFWPNAPMVALARRLRPRYRQYMLSNTDEIHLSWCREKFALDTLVDGMILSYEVGATKPDRRIYKRGLARFGLAAAECVFIDDVLVNLDGARACGIRGILATSADAVERGLGVLGVKA